VHVVSQQMLAQLTDIRETCCEHNACEDRPKGVLILNLLPSIILTQLPWGERKSSAKAYGSEIM